MRNLILSAIVCLCLIPSIQNEELLEDQCYYEEIPNFSLQQVIAPEGKTLIEYSSDQVDWLHDRFDCYKKCCDDEFQIGTAGRCSAAAFFMGPDNNLICKILACDPQDRCLWSPGTPGKFAGFIRSTKTTTTTQTTTTTTQITTPLPGVNTTGQSSQNNNSSVVATGNNDNNNNNIQNSNNSQTGTEANVVNTEGTQSNENEENTQETVGETMTEQIPPDNDKKPDTIHIQPMHRGGHQVPTKGLVAGIVLAVLLVILLISFLTKQLKGMKQPTQYKPIYEEEYQKLTASEDT